MLKCMGPNYIKLLPDIDQAHKRLQNEYYIGKQIGNGYSATVHIAYDYIHKRKVAIKIYEKWKIKKKH